MFLFVKTRNNELIKTINSEEISYDDIYTRLQDDELLGFASYVIITDNYYGLASTFHGPTNNEWLDFLNQIVGVLDIGGYEIESKPIMIQSTLDEVAEMPFVGRTVLEVDTTNSDIGKQLSRLLCLHDQDDIPEELRSFEITIKPQMRQYINDSFSNMAENLQDGNNDGVLKLRAKAKEELGDRLSEYYIVSRGQLGDQIQNTNDDAEIIRNIEGSRDTNEILREKIGEFLDNEKVREEEIEAFSNYWDLNTFRDHVLNNGGA